MAEFKMRNRPKKPTAPKHITFEVGDDVTFGYMLECIEKFKSENPDRNPRDMMVEVDENYNLYLVMIFRIATQC